MAVAFHRASQFVDTVNRYGGDAKLLSLPAIGIYGNTHTPFADKNNLKIADLLEEFLREKGLDGWEQPHKGPTFPQLKDYTIPLQTQKVNMK